MAVGEEVADFCWVWCLLSCIVCMCSIVVHCWEMCAQMENQLEI